LNSLIKLTDRK